MKLKTVGDVIVNIKNNWMRHTQIIFQDFSNIFSGTKKSINKPLFDFDLVNLNTIDNTVDKITLLGESRKYTPYNLDKDIKDTLFSKDIVKVSLGNKDTLIVKEFKSDKESTQIDVLMNKGSQLLDISDMNLQRKLFTIYPTNEFCDLRQGLKNISTINIHNLGRSDFIVYNDNTQDLRFTLGINSIEVDVIEEGGSFNNPNDYLGRLNFVDSDLTTVKKAFQQEISYIV